MRRNATIHIQNNTGYDLLLVSSMIEHGNFQHGGKLYLKESPKSADIDEIFSIASVHKCLDVSGAGTENGTNVIIHQSNNGTNQKWKLSDAGEGYFYFEPLNANGMVLDVYENKTQDGSKIAINEKNDGNNQKWKILSTIIDSGLFIISPKSAPDSCLGISGGKMDNGTPIILQSKNKGSNQLWYFTKI